MRQAQLFDFVNNETNNNPGPAQAFKKLREQRPEITQVETPLEKDRIHELTQINDISVRSVPDHHAAGADRSSVTDEAAPIKQNLPIIDENDPNKPLWDEIGSGSFDRNSIIERYRSLGETAVIENDRGLIDSHRRRAANFGQFFTPAPIAEFIIRLLKLDSTDLNPIILDNSCGIGGMFRYLSPTCRIAGIELEGKAYCMAKALFPEAGIINDNLCSHAELDSQSPLPFRMGLFREERG